MKQLARRGIAPLVPDFVEPAPGERRILGFIRCRASGLT
jgi:hypothetical protein